MANDFKRTVGAPITREEANEWIDKYDKEHRKDKMKDTKSVFYGRDIIEAAMANPEATGISFFLVSKNNPWAGKDTVQLVLVGTKEDGTLLWPATGAGKDGGGGGTPYDSGMVCPPACPTP